MSYFKAFFMIIAVMMICFCVCLPSSMACVVYQDDFADGNYTAAQGPNGLSWSVLQGGVKLSSYFRPNALCLYSPAGGTTLITSNQTISLNEFTTQFFAHSSYGQDPIRFVFLYQDLNNYYYLGLGDSHRGIYRVMDGIETLLLYDPYSHVSLFNWRSIGGEEAVFKVYVKNNGTSITIKVDRDQDQVDYDLEYADIDPVAVARFVLPTKIGFLKNGAAADIDWNAVDDIKVYDSLVSATAHSPVTYYVDAVSGDDARTADQAKSSATPWKTISKTVSQVAPGDTVLVKPGVYPEKITLRMSPRNVSGKSGALITFKADPRRQAQITGVDTTGADYARVEGFEIAQGGITLVGNYNEAIDNYIYDSPGYGISGNGSHYRIVDNHIYRPAAGIVLSGSYGLAENNEIERLIVRDTDADNFRFFGEYHVIRGNYMHGTLQSEIGSSHTDGFQTFDNAWISSTPFTQALANGADVYAWLNQQGYLRSGSMNANILTIKAAVEAQYPDIAAKIVEILRSANVSFVHHILIENNLVTGFYAEGFMGEAYYYGNSYDVTFRNNIFKDSAMWGLCSSNITDMKVYNNLFINNAGFTSIGEGPGEIKNNIFYNTTYGLSKTSTVQASNNLMYREQSWRAPTQADYPHDIVNKIPFFVNKDGADYHLHAISPLINAGADLTPVQPGAKDIDGIDRPQRGAWDIGPFEYHGEMDNKPVAVILVNEDQGYELLTVHFDGANSYNTSGATFVSYSWDFGDGTQVQGAKVVHCFSAGTYDVTLTVVDGAGKTAVDHKKVSVLASGLPNLAFYLSMDNTTADTSGRAVATVVYGSPAVYGTGAMNAALDLKGGTLIDAGNNQDVQGLEEFAISFWAKKNVPATTASLVYFHVLYNVTLSASGFTAAVNTDQASVSASVASGTNNTDWHHYAVTCDSVKLRLYLDGVEKAAVPYSGTMKRDPYQHLSIGRDPWTSTYFDGLLDEVRVYDRALTAAEVLLLAQKKDLPGHGSKGDVSGDGRVTMYDAALVLKYTVGGTLTTLQQTQADINGDSKIDAADTLAIARKALGLN